MKISGEVFLFRDPTKSICYLSSLMQLNLVVFLTRGMSLHTWDALGIFDREVALYLALRDHGVHVSLLSCGGVEDLAFEPRMPGIRILCNRWNIPVDWYARCIPVLHARALLQADIIKTNQMKGSELALVSACFWRRPLLARCGYLWSDLAAHGGSGKAEEAAFAGRLEAKVFGAAKQAVVTTPPMKEYVIDHYRLNPATVTVIPNYVVPEYFRETNGIRSPDVVIFVGRLSSEKNPLALVRACEGLPCKLIMAGEGPLHDDLVALGRHLRVDLVMAGTIPHAQLPELYRTAGLFVLPSPHEGHPKTLIEAMACGTPVIGANTPGIREVILHGETGWLCETDPESIRAAIQHLMANPDLRATLGANARKFAVENYSLDKIVEMELEVYRKIRGRG